MEHEVTYIGNPHLTAIQDVSAIGLLRRRLHAYDVGTSGVLRHSQRPDLGAQDEAR